MGIDVPSARWPLLLATFVRLFLSDVGAERDSFLSQMAGFKVGCFLLLERMAVSFQD
jgi:hypothetical protein